jgi:uncharacterized coiled-coil DUF342 family protein
MSDDTLEQEVSTLEARLDELNHVRARAIEEMGTVQRRLADIIHAVSEGGLGKANTIEKMQNIAKHLNSAREMLKSGKR